MPAPSWVRNKQPARKEFIPSPTSGHYTILVSMYKAKQSELIENLTKLQIEDLCTRYFPTRMRDKSKVWASMKTLIDRALINRQISRDPIYTLTPEGQALAIKLIDTTDNNPASAASDDDEVNPLSSQVLTQNDGTGNFELKAGEFDIILAMDSREKLDIKNFDETIKCEIRTLACGDFVWLARPKGINPTDRTRDLVLDYVVERKRTDDLWQSKCDGRLEQQKDRLLNSGIRRPVFLIEEFGTMRNTYATADTINQLIVGILLRDGIRVERAKNLSHTVDYLRTMTRCITKLYSKMNLKSCDQDKLRNEVADIDEMITWHEFQTKTAKIKNWTVSEMFAKHLIQIMGMSAKHVAVIIEKYPTLTHLMRAYRKCFDDKERESLLAKLQVKDQNRTIGPALSRKVYHTYKRR